MKKSVAAPTDLLIFNHTSAMSGGEIALVDLLRFGIADSVHVHTDQEGPLLAKLTALPNVTCSTRIGTPIESGTHVNRAARLTNKMAMALRMRSSYKKIMENFGGKVVYANTLRSALIISTMRLKKRKFVYHQRDQLTSEYLGKYTSIFSKALIGMRADLVIANSQSTAETAPQAVKRLEVVPSAVADIFFELAEPDKTDVVRILMLGRISPWKGQLEFLKALHQLNESTDVPSWSVKIVGGVLFGEDEYLEAMEDYISKNDLSSRVTLVGHVENPVSYVDNCEILVHSSVLPEPFGQVVAQGMAAGRAIIASNSGGPAEILSHLSSAILIDPTNTREFSAALKLLIKDEYFRSIIGKNARLDAEPFRIDRVAGMIRTLLWELLGKISRRDDDNG